MLDAALGGVAVVFGELPHSKSKSPTLTNRAWGTRNNIVSKVDGAMVLCEVPTRAECRKMRKSGRFPKPWSVSLERKVLVFDVFLRR